MEIGAVSADEAKAVTSLSLGIVCCCVANERNVLKTLLCHIPSAFIQPRINKVEDCADSNAGTCWNDKQMHISLCLNMSYMLYPHCANTCEDCVLLVLALAQHEA